MRGRLKILKLDSFKLRIKPKMHVVNFKRFPKFTKRRKTLLRLLSGKSRGFIVRKNKTSYNEPRDNFNKLVNRTSQRIYAPNFSLKRKKKIH